MGDDPRMGWRQQIGLTRADLRYYSRHRRWAALARALFATNVRRYYSELCQECGRPYPFMWWSPQPLWDELMPSYGGLLCPRCFDQKATAAGVRVQWTPMVVARDGEATTNHWFDETRDALMMGEPDPGYVVNEKVRQPQPTWAVIKPMIAPDTPSQYPAENLA